MNEFEEQIDEYYNKWFIENMYEVIEKSKVEECINTIYNKKISMRDIDVLLNILEYNRLFSITLISIDLNNIESIENKTLEIMRVVSEENKEKINQINININNGINMLISELYPKVEENNIIEIENGEIKKKKYKILDTEIYDYLTLAVILVEKIGSRFGCAEMPRENYLKLKREKNLLKDSEENRPDILFKRENLNEHEELNEKIKNIYGLTMNEMENKRNFFLEYKINENIMFYNILSFIMDKESFFNIFFYELKKENFEKIFSEMIYINELSGKKWIGRSEYVVNAPLIKIKPKIEKLKGDFYIGCPGLTIFYFDRLIRDIYDEQTRYRCINETVRKILREEDRRFEKFIYNRVKEYTDVVVMNNLNLDRKAELDVIVVGRKGIYIIECKNHKLKMFPNEINRAKSKISELNNTLENKKKQLRKMMKQISGEMNIDYNLIKNLKIKSILVTSEIAPQFSYNDALKYDENMMYLSFFKNITILIK